MTERASACELAVAVEAAEGALARLAAAFASGPIASVVIRPAGGRSLTAADARPLVELAQSKDAAALIENDAALARALRADGVHLAPQADVIAAFTEAKSILGERYIVGASTGPSRHDAMTVAEQGVDYVGFGLSVAGNDPVAAEEQQLDFVSWWAEIFSVPCVAFHVTGAEAAARLATAGADFVAVTLEAGLAVGDARERIEGVRRAIGGRRMGGV